MNDLILWIFDDGKILNSPPEWKDRLKISDFPEFLCNAFYNQISLFYILTCVSCAIILGWFKYWDLIYSLTIAIIIWFCLGLKASVVASLFVFTSWVIIRVPE